MMAVTIKDMKSVRFHIIMQNIFTMLKMNGENEQEFKWRINILWRRNSLAQLLILRSVPHRTLIELVENLSRAVRSCHFNRIFGTAHFLY
mmetsp:Transcript_22098/g.45203  ORF Transcript_22098/g.45203 Transcript_22098/m.45203 type:complete len:90 (+) Transcript_22098:614-883(+)